MRMVRPTARRAAGQPGMSARQQLHVQPIPCGYGALHVESDDGERQTWLSPDPDYVRTIVDAQRDVQTGAVSYESLASTELAEHKFTVRLPRWPDQWTLGTAFWRGPWSPAR